MKKIKFSIVAFLALFLSYNAYTTSQQKAEMPDIVKANIEALAYWEYGSDCIEWVDKYCYTEEQFSEIHGPYYYATCSGNQVPLEESWNVELLKAVNLILHIVPIYVYSA